MSEILIRPYELGDETKITDLFLQCSYHKRTTHFWHWINRKGPFGESIVFVGEIDGEIIGTYAVMPVQLTLDNTEYKSGFALQLAFHPDYRGYRNTLTLTRMVLDECKKSGMDFIYGFPNDTAFPLHIKAMGWEHLCDFRCMEIYLKDIAFDSNIDKGINVERVHSFSRDIDDIHLKSSINHKNKLHIQRNQSYLNWRFIDHPIEHYIVFVSKIKEKTSGYIVLKIYHQDNLIYGHLVDFLTNKDNEEEIFQALLHHAIKFFKHSKVDIISTWSAKENPYFYFFDRIGFKASGFNTHFVLKPIINGLNSSHLNFDNWYLSMADTDAF